MSWEDDLSARADHKCELCAALDDLAALEVTPPQGKGADTHILLCMTCRTQIADAAAMEPHHWRCLNDSMWTQIPAVQVMAARTLKVLSGEAWARDLLDTLYLEDEVQAWVDAAPEAGEAEPVIIHKDSNGAILSAGDVVTLIKDLNVKGTSFVAKRGTVVRNISLVQDNQDHIEGRINSQQIVILTKFTKKSG